jgi:hypothetical protein
MQVQFHTFFFLALSEMTISTSHCSCFNSKKKVGIALKRGSAPEPVRAEMRREISLSLPLNEPTAVILLTGWEYSFYKSTRIAEVWKHNITGIEILRTADVEKLFFTFILLFLLTILFSISQLPQSAGCHKSPYHSKWLTVLRCPVIMVYNFTNRKHHTSNRKISGTILHPQCKTKLKHVWSTATATSQNSLLLRSSDQNISYYKKLLFCNLLHTLLFPTLQTGIFPSALCIKQICPYTTSKIRILWTSIFRLLGR